MSLAIACTRTLALGFVALGLTACVDLVVARPSSSAPSAENPTTVDDVTLRGSEPAAGSCPEIGASSADELDTLLHAGEYEALDARLYAYLDAYKANAWCEPRLEDAWKSMSWRHEEKPEALDDWVAGSKRPAAALTARGHAYVDAAYAARGSKWARDTPEESFRRMHELMRAGRADLLRAIELQPDSPIPVEVLAWGAKASSGQESLIPILERHLALDPRSLAARAGVIAAFEPKWGGDLAVMHRIAAEAQPHAELNPRLVSLQGLPHGYLAWEAWRDEHLAEAHAHYTEALRFGDWGTKWSRDRSAVRRKLGDLPGALIDADRAVSLAPRFDKAWGNRARILDEMGRHEEALEAWDKAIEYAPGHRWYYEKRAMTLHAVGRHAEAIADLRKATELEPDRHWSWSRLGMDLADGMDDCEAAVPALETAARLRPQDPRNWFFIAMCHERAGEIDRAGEVYAHYLQLVAQGGSASKVRLRHARAFESRQRAQATRLGAEGGSDALPGLSGLGRPAS